MTPIVEFRADALLLSEDLELILPSPDVTDLLGLKPETVVHYVDVSEFEDLAGLDLLTEERRERVSRFHVLEDKVRCLAAGLLLRKFVGPKEPQYGPHGKPFLPDGPSFNLSHSGRYVVLAVSPGDVGVDIEEIRPRSEGVAEKCFLNPEQEWIRRQKDPERAFYMLWTAKEAVMKATGEGFHMPPESFRVFPAEAAAQDADGKDWYLHWLYLPGHIICLAAPETHDNVTMEQASRTELLGKDSGPEII